MTTDIVMEKLRKLIKHEESARSIGSIAEAEAFAEKIQQLLIEHKIEMAAVTAGDDHDDERKEEVEQQAFDPTSLGIPYSGKQRVAWIEALASVVAAAHFCRIIVSPGSLRFWFVGKPTDRLIAGNVFAALLRGAIAACDAKYNEARRDPWSDTSGFRASFYRGFVFAITLRLRSTRVQAETTQSTALVLAKADGAVQQYMEKQRAIGATTSAGGLGGSSRHNSGGYASGKAAGSRASINTPIAGSSAKQIGGK